MDRLPSSESKNPSRSKRNEEKDDILFTPDCIFCGKKGYIKVGKSAHRRSENTSYFERDGDVIVFKAAEAKKDEALLKRIRGKDLFAVEAKYHLSCKKRYIQGMYDSAKTTPEAVDRNKENIRVANEAYGAVVEHIEVNIIQRYRLVELAELNTIYMEKTINTEFHNPNHRSDDLLSRIKSDPYLCNKISYTLVEGRGPSFNLLFNKKITVGQAISKAYVLSQRDLLDKTAEYIRKEVKTAHANAEKLKWPPKAEDLLKETEVLPERLQRFLSILFTGRKNPHTEQSQRLIFSIEQDICRVVTNGEWLMAKHILLCVSFKHMFRSKQVKKPKIILAFF